MKDIATEITEVPKMFSKVFSSVEELHELLNTCVLDSIRSDKLMLQMLSPMLSTEAEKVKAEILAISVKNNALLKDKFGKDPLFVSNLLITNLMMMAFGQMMACILEESDRHLSPAQAHMLQSTGAFNELLTGKSN